MNDLINRANLPSVLNGITMSECDKVIEPFLEERSCDEVWHAVRALRDFYDWVMSENAVEPCKDAVSREWLLDCFGLSEKTRKHSGDYSGYDTRMLYEIQDAIEDAPPVTAETDIDDYMKGYDHGTADTWKIAQTVFGSTVTLYEAMDVAKCMKGAENETH